MRSWKPSLISRLMLSGLVALTVPLSAYAADTVIVSLNAAVNIQAVTTVVGGAKNSINVRLPTTGAITFASGTAAAQTSKMFVRQISLSASTPVTLDLTALTGGQGDTSFSKIKLFYLINNETAGSSKPVIIGNATNPFVGPFGAGSHTMSVAAGCTMLNFNKETAGWVVTDTTADSLKLDPGANAVSVTLVLAGN